MAESKDGRKRAKRGPRAQADARKRRTGSGWRHARRKTETSSKGRDRRWHGTARVSRHRPGAQGVQEQAFRHWLALAAVAASTTQPRRRRHPAVLKQVRRLGRTLRVRR